MLNNITELLTQSISTFSISEILITIILSIILGAVISITYKMTTDTAEYSRNFFLTLEFIPAVVAVVILLIGSNVASAFSLAGVFSIIRFRSTPGNPKDITYVLFSAAVGLACGLSCYLFAVIFSVILCAVMIIFYQAKFGQPKSCEYILKIMIPESLNFKGVFDETLQAYSKGFKLTRVKTADMGSVFELCYSITLNDGVNLKEFIDKIRCKNGNLTVLLSLADSSREF